jgi:transporter family protein
MDKFTLITALISLVGWGVGSFIAKLATNRIGEKAMFWDLLGYTPAVLIFCLWYFSTRNLFSGDKVGMLLGFLAGFIGSFGVIFFYLLLTKKDASMVVPLTALYPALAAILAVIFLKEPLTWLKGLGIVLSAVALVLLSL